MVLQIPKRQEGDMGKLLTFATIVTTALLLVGGIYAPEHPMMWLASTSQDFAIIRSVIMVALLGLLFTQPPRNVIFRGLLGGLAVVLVTLTGLQVNNYSILILDVFTFLQAAIIFTIAAIEPDPLADEETATLDKLFRKHRAVAVALFTAQTTRLAHTTKQGDI